MVMSTCSYVGIIAFTYHLILMLLMTVQGRHSNFKCYTTKTWEAYPTGLQLREPKNYEDLLEIMREAAEKKMNVKVVGKRHSERWNWITATNGYLVNTSKHLSRHLEIDKSILKESFIGKQMCQFEAGATINEVQNILWPPHHRKTNPTNYRYLLNTTNSYDLSLAGTIGTGAHGSGREIGAMADAVLSFRLITVDKSWKIKQYLVEPIDGITDPTRFKQNEKYKDIELIQNDELFNACVVNLGCIGIVYSYLLEVEPACYLEEERKIFNWNEKTKEDIRHLMNDNQVQSFWYMGSPYPVPVLGECTRQVKILISTLKVVDRPQDKDMYRSICLKRDLPVNSYMVRSSNDVPNQVPSIMSEVLDGLAHGPNVMNAIDALDTFKGAVPKGFFGTLASEYSMEIDNDGRKVIEITEKLFEFCQTLAYREQLINIPILFRFTEKTNKCMAMQNNRKSLMIAIALFKGTSNDENTSKELENFMRTEFNGRPHWGMKHSMDQYKLKDLYDEQDIKLFRKALDFFDPNKIFTNEFTKDVFDWYRNM